MATDEGLPLIKHQKESAARSEDQSQIEAQEDRHEVNRRNTHRENENTQYRPRNRSVIQACCIKVRSKFKHNHCCLWSSKAVILVLVWNLIVSFGINVFLDPFVYTDVIFKINVDDSEGDYYDSTTIALLLFGLSYGLSALLFVFYPLAGFLADLYWGRYTTVKYSLCFLFWSVLIMSFLVGLLYGSLILALAFTDSITSIINVTIISLIFGIPLFLGLMLFLCSDVAFSANVIQFGLDQLHDAPTESLTLYIHWYVITTQVGPFIIRLTAALASLDSYVFLMYLIPIFIGLATLFLLVTLCLERCKRHWFLIEPGRRNPYKLVYKVVKFAKDHIAPIRRSAFTYCEDKLPSRLDLGKEKYGGPFTTEEVENVKAFLGIFRVLLTAGPIFFVEFAFSERLPNLVDPKSDIHYIHTTNSGPGHFVDVFYGSGFFTPMLIIIFVLIYLCLLKPVIQNCVPGMLKRMGLGMILSLLSGLCTLVMGVVVGVVRNKCTLNLNFCGLNTYLIDINSNYLALQFILNVVSYLLLYISAFEFICAQSPQSMKGLLIGMFFAIKGVFKLLSVLILYLPIGLKCDLQQFIVVINDKFPVFPICGFIYYFINVVVAFIGIILFIIVAKRYEYRERDEPDNIYRYAEEYYANVQDEPNYDYDDYDNLNVETIR